MQDELVLLNRARALDQKALTQIHDTYYAAIFRYVVVRVNDHETAEDLTSEVFTRLLSALRDHTAPQKTLRGWLFSVASYVVKDFYRKKYRTQHTSLNESVPSQAPGPDKTVEMKVTQTELKAAITTLTEDQQNVIALRFGFDMSIREVAQTMGTSEGSVKMLQARAIATLSRKLAEWKV